MPPVTNGPSGAVLPGQIRAGYKAAIGSPVAIACTVDSDKVPDTYSFWSVARVGVHAVDRNAIVKGCPGRTASDPS